MAMIAASSAVRSPSECTSSGRWVNVSGLMNIAQPSWSKIAAAPPAPTFLTWTFTSGIPSALSSVLAAAPRKIAKWCSSASGLLSQKITALRQ